VQVVKDPLKTKGARLSMELTIAGRYMVYAPTGEGVGVSRRLDDRERERLRKETKDLPTTLSERGANGGGVIIRTAAHGAKREDFERELKYLHKLHEVLERRVAETVAPGLVFQEADLSVRVVRDIFSAHFERAIVDDEQQHHRLVSFFTRTAPELVERVELWKREEPLFEAYGVDKAIAGVLSRRVDLPSGGYLMIDYAEALTVIDVNSGSFTGRGRGAGLEETITRTNLEAAEEVVNQLRLRDIGGIIVIDFIDMDERKNRHKVMAALEEALKADRAPSKVLQFNDFGLVAITRKRVKQSLERTLSIPCAVCQATGMVKSPTTVANEIYIELRKMQKHLDRGDVMLRVNPEVVKVLKANNARWLCELEEISGKTIIVKSDPALHPEQFDIH
jgi:ribonuclease G